MNEKSFKTQLTEWRMKSRDAIVPSSALVLLYGQKEKTKIIQVQHEEALYSCVKGLEDPSDDLYNKLTQELKYTDLQVLEYIQEVYEDYLKDIRKSIKKLQSTWSKSYSQDRANLIINILGYDSIVAICDLVNDRLVPIELILQSVFQVHSEYGDHRRKKDKSEVYIDPRVLKAYNDHKENSSRTVIHTKNPAT